MGTIESQVIEGLSQLIMTAAHMQEREMASLRPNPDEMDAEIAYQKGRLKTLRKLRELFEDEMARSLEQQF